METRFIAVGNFGELRIVHIHAPKIKVLTLFFFPQPDWQLPVYCLELVVFGAQPIVALLDMVCVSDMPCQQTVAEVMTAAHQAHPNLVQAGDVPDWFSDCRSGHDFFLRPQHHEDMAQLANLHLALLATPFTALLLQAHPFTPELATNHQQHLQHYKHHHQLNAPGLRLMNRSFGESWTNQYMHTLFR